jgi:hypothetical protein
VAKVIFNNDLIRYHDKKGSFDSAQDDVILSEVEVLSTLNLVYMNFSGKLNARFSRRY